MQTRIRNRDYAILAVILMIAIAARVAGLGSSLWFDEIGALIGSIRQPVSEILSIQSSFNNHIFYSLQAKLSILIFGESNWSIRLPAVIFGVAGIAVLWRLACRVAGVIQAHISALLLALSYHHVWFSQNARGYTEQMFWCVASTIILINCLKTPGWKGWIAYGLVLSAGMYTHLTTAIFFLAQAVIVAVMLFRKDPEFAAETTVSGRDKWLMPLGGFLIGGLLTLLLYSPSLVFLFDSVMHIPYGSSVDVMKEYQSPIWAMLEILRSFARPDPVTLIMAIAAILLTVTGMISIFRKEPLVPVLVVLHIVILLAFLMSLSMRIWPRFFFVDIGFILFFITQGVYVCCQQIARFLETHSSLHITGKNLFVVSSALMVAISCVLLVRNYQFPKQDFESPIKYIEETKSNTDKVVTLGLSAAPYQKYYEKDWPAIESEEDLLKMESEATKTWLVIIFPTRTIRKYDGIMNHVGKNYSLDKTFRGTLGDGNILVFTSKQQD
jgi:uncharacterized membrane protein